MPRSASSASASASMRRRSIKPSLPRGSRAISRFSATVIHGIWVSSWNTVRTPSPWASSGPPRSARLPLIRIAPASGRSRPLSALISVLLPAPFSPTSACTSAVAADSEAPSSARTPPNDLCSPAHTTTDTSAAASCCVAIISLEVRSAPSPRRSRGKGRGERLDDLLDGAGRSPARHPPSVAFFPRKEGRRDRVYAGSLTTSLPSQGVPSSAAPMHIWTIAFGPESVNRQLRLSG